MVKAKGSITVFLSMTGILIMALLGTLLETARYTACANHSARTTRTAVDALLTEYNRPLYDHYRLFFIESAGPSYEKVLSRYIGNTLEAAQKGNMDFFGGELRKLSVTDKVFVGDDEASAFQREITEFMKRREIEKVWNKFLKKSEKIIQQDKKAKEIEENAAQQKKEAELDVQMIELMKLIDGISVSKGRISCQKEFVKMFVVKEKKSTNFGVTNAAVWKQMKRHLDNTPCNWEKINKRKFLSQVKNVLKKVEEAIRLRDKLKSNFEKIARGTEKSDKHSSGIKSLIDQMSVLESNKKILSETVALLASDFTDEVRGKLEKLWLDYDTSSIVFDYTGVEEKGGADNPMDSMSSSWKDGILNLVFDDTSGLSKKIIKNPDNYAKLYREQKKIESDYGKKVSRVADEEVELSSGLESTTNSGIDEFCLDAYIKDYFSGYSKKLNNWEQALEYEWEYIIAGLDSDRKNLESVLNRILLIRMVVNFTAICGDSARREQAYAAAAAVVGFTGMEPLIRFTQTLILVVWSYVEGLVDVSGIMQRRNVPVMKKSKDILTGFAQIFHITGKAISSRAKRYVKEGETSFGYQEYVTLFLIATKGSIKRYRMMDLIQWNMKKNGYRNFNLGLCVFSIQVSASYAFGSRFFRMSAIEAMLGRDIREFTYLCEVSKGYL